MKYGSLFKVDVSRQHKKYKYKETNKKNKNNQLELGIKTCSENPALFPNMHKNTVRRKQPHSLIQSATHRPQAYGQLLDKTVAQKFEGTLCHSVLLINLIL